MARASDGLIFTGGEVSGHAFIAKIGSDLSLMSKREFAGSKTESIDAITIGDDGAVYAAGTTQSDDFPAQPLDDAVHAAGSPRAFVLKFTSSGDLQYAALAPGSTTTYARGIAVNAKGEVLLSGQTVPSSGLPFPATPGTVTITPGDNFAFLLKIDSTGSKMQLAIHGFGLGPVAYGPGGDIYVAGAYFDSYSISATAGAFQTRHVDHACAGTAFVGIGCNYQGVARISADGTRLIYSTFVAGGYGEQPMAIFVDSDGNALLAGFTFSNDYPITTGAYQTTYRATNYPPLGPPTPHPGNVRPPASGYLTKLNNSGTALIWSTFFGGTGSESITSVALDAQGNIAIAGLSGSKDLPGASTAPSGCTAAYHLELPYFARFSPDAKLLLESRYIYGFDSAIAPFLALGQDSTTVVGAADRLTGVSSAASRLSCTNDSADSRRISRVVPGQLLTLFGSALGDTANAWGGEQFPDTLGGVRISFDDTPAPLLYTSADQVNLQVPYEVAGRDVVTLTATTGDGNTFSRLLRVLPTSPSSFLTAPYIPEAAVLCKGLAYGPSALALILNEDGTQNSCENPAKVGTVISAFLNGLGQAIPGLKTGDVNDDGITAAAPVITIASNSGFEFVAARPAPGLISGVWRIDARVTTAFSAPSLIPLVNGQGLPSPYLAVWVTR